MRIQQLAVEWRGRERYSATWEHQLELHALRRVSEGPDRLVLVEHDPVITLGRQGDLANLLLTEDLLQQRGVDFHRVERGGDVTYHGPGQLVGYPIIDLRARGLSVRELMRGLEETVIRTLAEYGINAGRHEGLTGVWMGDSKLAALGVAVKNGISFHGFALNVATDLSYFEMIVPCGITDKRVASISSVTGNKASVDDVRPRLLRHFVAVFGYSGMMDE